MKMKHLLFLWCWVTALFLSASVHAQSSTVAISQVYGGGGNSGATYTHDFIELFNRGNAPISLTGWSVQYASATGSSWQKTNLSGNIQPGQYFLIQQAKGTGGTSALPTPDVSGTIALSGTAGKVALVNTITALAGTCPTAEGSVIDFVGFGTTVNCFEGTGPTAAPSNTTAVIRDANGCTDTNNNSADFAAGAPAPRNSTTVANPCLTGVVISINDVTVNEQNTGSTTATFTVTLSEPAATPVTFDIATQNGTATAGSDYTAKTLTAQSIPAGSTTYTFAVQVTSDTQAESDETFAVNLTNTVGAAPSSLSATGTITNDDGVAITPIYTIQGSGAASLLVGQNVTTTGVVTGDYQGSSSLNGFFMQDAAGDNSTATSDGIFVFAPNSVDVAVSQVVQVTGTVTEAFGQTQIGTVTNISPQGTATVTPTLINLPVATTGALEQLEGMLVTFPEKLTVSQNFTLARFGEVWLSADLDYPFEEVDGRLYNPTNFIDPTDTPANGVENDENNKAAVMAQQDLHDRASILLDDASGVQNPGTVPYLGSDNTLRVGSTVNNLTGILSFGFSAYRLQPTQAPAFTYAPRPLAPPSVGAANVKIASFNVLNYFNGNGSGGGFPTPRGADSQAEFDRQRVKIIAAIKSLDADVIGLLEIENDGDEATSAIADLVRGLNEATSPNTYDYIRDPANGGTGTDAIKVAFIYKPGAVTPIGAAIADANAVHNRPPLAQTFKLNATGETVTAVINHFKSKGGTGSGADADQGDGQAAFNATRVKQAEALVSFINTTVIPAVGDNDVILLGDLNAYNEEDPIDVLRAVGFINLFGPESYSYVFDGQSGSLDHALVTPSLYKQFTAGGKWHINADEPIFLDYNTEFNGAGFYEPTPFRSSDHDPVLVGLELTTPTISFTQPSATIKEDSGTYTVTLTASIAPASDQKIKININDYNLQYGEKKDYVTNPSGATGSFILTLAAGQTITSFTVAPDKNVASKKNTPQLDFNISEVSGGATIGIPSTFVLVIEDKKDITTNKISTYPNPATSQATIKVEHAGAGDITITLYDQAGTAVLSKKVHSSTDNLDTFVEVSQFRRGDYLLIVTTPNGTVRNHLLLK